MSMTIFWLSLCFVVYTYAAYPVLLWVRRMWTRSPIRKNQDYCPRVSFLIVAHDEERVIRAKLENTIKLDYPKGKMEIIVASDGSSDATNDIVRQFERVGVSLLDFPLRRGKTAVLNSAMAHCHGDIVVLSDARQEYEIDAVRKLVANFSDPTIGGVTGDLQLRVPHQSGTGEQIGVYWRYEKWIRRLQTEIDSTPVVTGAIYAIRRNLFQALPETIIADDLAMPMNMITQGFRVVYDSSAIAYDYYPRSINEDFRKRVRTIAGSYQYLMEVPRVLDPRWNRVWLDFVSHKVCRILVPVFLLSLLGANLMLTTWLYQVLLLFQLGFYGLALVGGLLMVTHKEVPRVISVPYLFTMLNVVACVALFKLVTGGQTHLWRKG